ncbi:MAG: succinylglutamate desuccinylase/aspartoacylase family protein [Proteobacteria bacterium]|nr:succinylglutamate desuccinylase/aspartoacylase family protein [Pseudomonadota bacterium]
MSISPDLLKLLSTEIDFFRKTTQALIKRHGGMTLAEDVHVIGPHDKEGDSEKPYPFATSAIIHGNEIAGLASLNAFCEFLLSEEVRLSMPIVIFLGNVKAAYAGVRSLDSDLNRNFGRPPKPGDHESQRVQDLKKVLAKVRYYFDLHQTIGPCPKGFFIFSHTDKCYHFARGALPRQDMVTYWDGIYTTEGMCSDQYVNALGGVAITLELGALGGFQPWQVSLGFLGVLSAYRYVRYLQKHGHVPHWHQDERLCGQLGTIYTWQKVVPYPSNETVVPLLTSANFSFLKAGTPVAMVDGKPLLLDVSGYQLFASYYNTLKDNGHKPHELLRILKVVSHEEFSYIQPPPPAVTTAGSQAS